VVATGFDETSNHNFIAEKSTKIRGNNFGKRPVVDSRIIPANPQIAEQENLDVPTFLRKKM
jgi:hypothetical protein